MFASSLCISVVAHWIIWLLQSMFNETESLTINSHSWFVCEEVVMGKVFRQLYYVFHLREIFSSAIAQFMYTVYVYSFPSE